MSNHVKHKRYLKPEPMVVRLHIRYELTQRAFYPCILISLV